MAEPCYAYSMEINENHMWANLTDEDMLDFDAQAVHPV